jgi:hypothetical protein
MYDEVTEPTLDQLVPEARAYLEELAEVDVTYTREIQAARGLGWREESREASQAARDHRVLGEQQAWAKLGASAHPLVAWIGQNAGDYQTYARTVLRYVTPDVTVQTLDAVAEANDWCYVWGQFRSRAITAGALPARDWQVQMRVNGGPWQSRFWEHHGSGGAITKDMINALIERGVSFIELETGSDNVKYQVAEKLPDFDD